MKRHFESSRMSVDMNTTENETYIESGWRKFGNIVFSKMVIFIWLLTARKNCKESIKEQVNATMTLQFIGMTEQVINWSF